MSIILVGAANQSAKKHELEVKEFQKSIDLINRALNPDTAAVAVEPLEALRRSAYLSELSFKYGIVSPIDAQFIYNWEKGDYGDPDEVDLGAAVLDNYEAFSGKKDKEVAKAIPYTTGMAVKKFGLYTFKNQTWQWIAEDLAACWWDPGTKGVSQWQLVG